MTNNYVIFWSSRKTTVDDKHISVIDTVVDAIADLLRIYEHAGVNAARNGGIATKAVMYASFTLQRHGPIIVKVHFVTPPAI